MKRIFSFLLLLILGIFVAVYAQFPYGTTGLLHMPTADMQRDKTFMFGGAFLSRGATPKHWYYDTYNYYINVTIFPCIEIGYLCTMNKGEEGSNWPQSTWGKFTNQDRMFSVRLRVIEEGQFISSMPSIVIGGNDATTRPKGGSNGFYSPDSIGNGYWNRWYIAATKHFNLSGELGIHTAYVYNNRLDYHLNGLALGLNWKPYFHKKMNLMVEYDSRTLNCGLGYTLWKDYINFVGELNDFKYISAGVSFKVHLK